MKRSARATCIATLIGAVLLTLTACGGEESTQDDLTVDASSTGSSHSPRDDDEAAVRDVVERYWDACIRTQSEPTHDPAVFHSSARGSFIEADLTVARSYAEMEFRRVGRPEIGEPTLEATDDGSYVATVCVDERVWGGELEGEAVPPRLKRMPGTAATSWLNSWTTAGSSPTQPTPQAPTHATGETPRHAPARRCSHNITFQTQQEG